MPVPQIEVRYAPTQPSLSDLIQVEITLSGAPPDVVLSPVNIAPDCVTMQRVRMAQDRAHLLLSLDPIRPGPCRIPAFHTQCLHSAAPACDIRSDETTITISTMIPPGTTDPDIRDRNEPPLPITGKSAAPVSHFPWSATTCCFVIAVALWLWRHRRRTPIQKAQVRLKTANTFEELTAVFRDYLDQRAAISTASTSPELAATLLQRALIEGPPFETLERYLAAADRAKFAGVPVTSEQLETARIQCAQLIRILDSNIERSTRARL